MGFLDSVQVPTQPGGMVPTAPPKGGGGFLDSTYIPTPQEQAEATKINSLRVSADQAKQAAEQAGSFGGRAMDTLKGIGESIASPFVAGYEAVKSTFQQAPKTPLSNLNMQAGLQKGWDTISKTITDAGDKLDTAAETAFDNHTSLIQKGVNVGEAGMGVLNSLFLIVTAPLATMSTIPVVGQVADGINALFSAVGAGASDIAVKGIVNNLPISPDTKKTITPLVSDISALAGQLLLGKAGGDIYGKIAEKTKGITNAIHDDVATQVKVVSESPETSVPINTPATKHANYARSQGYEPYTPPENLPTIQMGAKPKETLPSVQESESPNVQTKVPFEQRFDSLTPEQKASYRTLTKQLFGKGMDYPTARETAMSRVEYAANGKGTLTFEPMPTGKGSFVDNTHLPESASELFPTTVRPSVTASTLSEAKVPRTTGAIKPVEGTGELKTRGLSQGVEAQAIQNKLTEGFGDLPTYRTVDLGEQAKSALDFMQKDPQGARDVAMGNRAPPHGLLPESVFVALERAATANGDAGMLRDLANSRLASAATTMGQRIRTLGERDPESPTAAIQTVQDARAATLKEKGINSIKESAKISDEVKAEIKKTSKATTRPAWEDFIKSIQCGY